MTIDEFEKLKTRVEDAQRAADRAAGELSQLKKRLKKDFGVDKVSTAKRLLAKIESETAGLEREFKSKLRQFEKTHSQ